MCTQNSDMVSGCFCREINPFRCCPGLIGTLLHRLICCFLHESFLISQPELIDYNPPSTTLKHKALIKRGSISNPSDGKQFSLCQKKVKNKHRTRALYVLHNLRNSQNINGSCIIILIIYMDLKSRDHFCL